MLTYTLNQLAQIFGISRQRMYELRDKGHGPATGGDGKVQTEDALAWGARQVERLGKDAKTEERADRYLEGVRRLHRDRVAQYAEIARRHAPTIRGTAQAEAPYRKDRPAVEPVRRAPVWGSRLGEGIRDERALPARFVRPR